MKPYDIQILTPMRKGELGVERLNQVMQQYLNPPSDEKKEKEIAFGLFREGDKVMQIKNNYQIEWEMRNSKGFTVIRELEYSMVIWESSQKSMITQRRSQSYLMRRGSPVSVCKS